VLLSEFTATVGEEKDSRVVEGKERGITEIQKGKGKILWGSGRKAPGSDEATKTTGRMGEI